MSSPELRPAALDETALGHIRRLEETLGTPVVAYEPESPFAELSETQLAEVRRVETTLGVRLLAYRP